MIARTLYALPLVVGTLVQHALLIGFGATYTLVRRVTA